MDGCMPDTELMQDLMFEEVCLSMQATDIIRKSRHLFRLHNLRTSQDAAPPRKTVKRAAQALSPVDIEDMRRKILWELEQERIYTNEDLTVSAFAHALGIEPYQLSRFLNIHLRTTFTNLVNSYRVLEARDLLTGNSSGSILDIAFSSGFNSKASFNRIFKQRTGMTPSEYRMKSMPGRLAS